MKNLLFILLINIVLTGILFAQKLETFDIISYQTPKGWQKEAQANTVQLGVENSSGGICLITIFKSLPGAKDSRANFAAAWDTLVKETVTVKSDLQMMPSSVEKGWIVETGLAQYENDGKQGAVMLVTISGDNKMVNILFLMNTDAFQKDISDFLSSVNLKQIAQETAQPKKAPINSANNTETTKTNAKQDGFAFTTSNFDDGWTSTVQEDWVEVTKGDLKVLIHYPSEKVKAANTDVPVMCEAAWNALVAPRYSQIENYRVGPNMMDYQRPYYAEATLTDTQTGKKVFVVLFKKVSEWMEIVTPDRNTFIQNFGVDISTLDRYADSAIWNKLMAMKNYNKFAVAAADLKGEWSNTFNNNTYYANIYTGMSAGMNTYSSSITFLFGAGQTYKWQLVAANSFAGKTDFAQAKGAGIYKVLNNWQVLFPNIEGKPVKYDVYFSIIKGGRILWMNEVGRSADGFDGFARVK